MKILPIKLMLITTACFHNENWVAPLYHMAMLIPLYHISGSARELHIHEAKKNYIELDHSQKVFGELV